MIEVFSGCARRRAVHVLWAVLQTGFAEGAVTGERIEATIFLLEWQLSSTGDFVTYWSE